MQPTHRHENALYLDPNANPGQVEGNNRNTNILQEEGVTMTTRVTEQAESFNDTIDVAVAGATVSPWSRTDGTPTVEIDFGDEAGIKSFTPEAACALATALQAVAVHVMEQQPREIRRITEPGAPAFEEAI